MEEEIEKLKNLYKTKDSANIEIVECLCESLNIPLRDVIDNKYCPKNIRIYKGVDKYGRNEERIVSPYSEKTILTTEKYFKDFVSTSIEERENWFLTFKVKWFSAYKSLDCRVVLDGFLDGNIHQDGLYDILKYGNCKDGVFEGPFVFIQNGSQFSLIPYKGDKYKEILKYKDISK